jgi:cell division protein ZapE
MTQSLTPWQAYQHALDSGNYEPDPAQAYAMHQLDQLFQRLHVTSLENLSRHFFRRKVNHFSGIYLYGEVGAGKTWMMDLFYQCLRKKKRRFHFHQFMGEIHLELKRLQGHKNPLKIIAKNLAKTADIICFDELFVNDIADAMLLASLFKFMFAQGIFFVMTSNRPPDDLYLNGLQRSRFYPAIELLNAKMQLIKVQSLKDYRWREALSNGVYFAPLDHTTAEALQTLFAQLTLEEMIDHDAIEVNQRAIACVASAQDVVWLDFSQLCHTPRCAQDYLSLSKRFKIFILDQVPVIPPEDDNAISYLISLVDVLYDARCRLVLRAAAAPKDLYAGDKLKFEFQRTLSRLQEMQTQTYWT